MSRYISISAIIFPLFLIASAHGTTLTRVDFNEQAARADLVVMGRATRIEDVSRQGFPFRRVIIAVEEVFGGEYSGGEVAVLQPGGRRADGGQARVVGVKYLRPGDETLLFLRKDPSGDYRVIGLSQGQYSVKRETRAGRKIILITDSGGHKKAMTVGAARRRVHAVRTNAAAASGKKTEAGK